MTGIVVRSKIKEIMKKIDPEETVNNVSADIGDTLDHMVEDILRKGIDRARKNQRKTLLSRDL